MTDPHFEMMNRFYSRKWSGCEGFWLQHYPDWAQAYACALGQTRNEAIARALPPRSRRSLDIGCGLGDLTVLLADRSEIAVGVDVVPVNVQRARANLQRASRSNARFLQASAEGLPFQRNRFDLVVMADVIEHVREVDAALAEVARVLRPGGIFLCVTPVAGMQRSLVVLDAAARRLVGLIRASSTRRADHKPSIAVFERFLSLTAMRKAIEKSGLRPVRYRRICFYPGPEGGGVIGNIFQRIHNRMKPERFRRFSISAVRLFSAVERLGILNQKQLWVVERRDFAGRVGP